MGEVKLYVHKPEKMQKISRFYGPNSERQYIHAADYDAAQSELAALREELATLHDQHAEQSCIFCNNSGELLTEVKSLRKRLTAAEHDLEFFKTGKREQFDRAEAAEQRNAELVELLDEVLNEVPHGWGESFSESELAERIRQVVKPTESGASE